MSQKSLPHGWARVKLGDVLLSVVGGGTSSRKNPAYFNGQIPWFTVKDMHSLRPNDSQEHISERAVQESATNIIPANTLIIATRIALGKAIKPTVACAINQDLKALINPGYGASAGACAGCVGGVLGQSGKELPRNAGTIARTGASEGVD